ncbi:MAG: hypothetical protein LBP35_07120 [Candidatus Ancillula trichonymphae]|jgi:hypothetical protein|nr:hypothetical protein [Candidatus Ancillula trichonymphae]
MASINVSYEELSSAVSSVESSRDNTYNELDTLRNRIQELTTSGFVTEKTSGAFNVRHTATTQRVQRRPYKVWMTLLHS